MHVKFEWKKDPANGYWIGPDTCHYEHQWQALSIGVLGMCGCGQPEEAYDFLRAALSKCDRRGVHNTPPLRQWIDAESEIIDMVKCRPEIVAHILLHFLTDKGVLDHGGSVGGSWLTPAGEDIVDSEGAATGE